MHHVRCEIVESQDVDDALFIKTIFIPIGDVIINIIHYKIIGLTIANKVVMESRLPAFYSR